MSDPSHDLPGGGRAGRQEGEPDEDRLGDDGDGSTIFRREALDHHAGRRVEGDVLRISPSWTKGAFWVLVGAVAAAVAYSAVGTVGEYASGPAVIRAEGRVDLAATTPGVVARVEVTPGQRVAAGEVLVRLQGGLEAGELERLTREFERALAESLRDPSDAAARAALAQVRASRDLAEARVDERLVRAPRAGVVRDVRVRPGQHLAPGQPLLSLVDDTAPFTVVAMLPGHYRPLLRPGMRLRLELAGFRYAYQDLVIESLGQEIVGPGEVRRFLGPELADAVPVAGPVVLVTGRLPAATFRAEGGMFAFYDGMQGSAEARVRDESILMTLVPGLRGVLREETP